MRRSFFRLALLRLLRTGYFPAMLVLFAAAAVASSAFGGGETMPRAGIVDADGSALSAAVAERLCENGFELCGDEETLLQSVGDGTYDCGAVLVDGFGDMIRRGETDGVAEFVSSPSSLMPQLFRDHMIAAIYAEYAPYITADVISETDITADEVIEKYGELMDEGALFSFKITEFSEDAPASERAEASGERSYTYTLFASSLLIFAMVMYASCSADAGLTPRIGAKNELLYVRLPGIAALWLLLLAAVGVVCAVFAALGRRAEAGLFMPLCAYSLLLVSFGAAVSAILGRPGRVLTMSFIVILASLALCPLYFDAAAIVPLAGILRRALPTYWLWMCADGGTLTAFAAALLLLPAALTASYFRLRHAE